MTDEALAEYHKLCPDTAHGTRLQQGASQDETAFVHVTAVTFSVASYNSIIFYCKPALFPGKVEVWHWDTGS